MDNWDLKPQRRGIREIPVAPILDMMVAVIFFLLLSTTFIDYTMQALPPAQVDTITDPLVPPPVSPKLYTYRTSYGLRLLLRWSGENPGQDVRDVAVAAPGHLTRSLVGMTDQLIADFKKRYPKQTTLQMGFAPDVSYQDMISIMDGAHVKMRDLVLLSYTDTAAVVEKVTSQ